MKPLMSKVDLENFLEKEFPQVSSNFKILNTKPNSLSMLMHISDEHLRPGGTVSGPTMFLLADVSFYLATLSIIGPKSLTVTTNCSINFLGGNLFSINMILFSQLPFDSISKYLLISSRSLISLYEYT